MSTSRVSPRPLSWLQTGVPAPRPVLAQLAAAVYNADYHPPVDARTAQYRERSFAHHLARLARHVTPPATLLDVGCGDGAFLRCAQAAGWDVAGSDIHLTAGARRTGVRLFEGPLPDIHFDGDRFDAIRFNQVLEHTPDPLAQVRAARRVVTDGGILLIGVPTSRRGASVSRTGRAASD